MCYTKVFHLVLFVMSEVRQYNKSIDYSLVVSIHFVVQKTGKVYV